MNDQKQQVALAPSRLKLPSKVAEKFGLDQSTWQVLVDQTFPNAKSTEAVVMALSYCKARNLDVFKKPVHIVPMWSSEKNQMVETVWPGISEIRTTAFRTGQYAGADEVVFGPMIERSFAGVTGRGQYEKNIEKSVRYPEWAKMTVYRLVDGHRCAFTAVVYWEETYSTIGKSDVPNDMWGKRPRGQAAKCVEAAALRMAFPEEIGSLYSADEMDGQTITGDVAHAVDSQPQRRPPKPPQEEPAQPAADVVDGEIIEHDEVQEPQADDQSGLDPDPDEQEPADAKPDEQKLTGEATKGAATKATEDEFLDDLKAKIDACNTLDDLADVWESMDVAATLTHDAQKLGIANGFKLERQKVLSK